MVGAHRIRAVDGAFPKRGSRVHHSLGTRAGTVDDDSRVTRSEPPRLLELEAHGGPFAAVVRFRLVPDATGTTVVMEEGGADGRSRLAMRVGRRLVAARNAETLWRLKQEILSGGNGAPAVTEAESRLPLPRWLADTTARTFGLTAAARRARAFHPRGVTRTGEAELWGAGRLLTGRSRTEVVVRFSRGLGLSAALPDFNGLAVRFVDVFGPGRHQDLLLTSAAPGRFGRLPFPAVDFGTSRFSSIVRYRVGGVPVRLAARVQGTALTLDRLATAEPLKISLSAGAHGHRDEIGAIVLHGLTDGSVVRFAPVPTGPEVVPLGLLNALRRPAYDASQAVRSGLGLGEMPDRET